MLEQRSAFGVHRVRQVTLDHGSTYHVLVHGNTVHGVQRRDAGHLQAPQAYYVPSGPVGQVFATLGLGAGTRPVGVVGLGAGGLACYGGPGQSWQFFEIDPLVAEIARDPRYFTFLRDCPPRSEVVLGDGRLTLSRVPDAHFGAIVLDAYSSDAIPVHLLTREALSLYLRKLAPGGVLVFHLSSRHLDLAPVLGGLAAGAGLDGRGADGRRRTRSGGGDALPLGGAGPPRGRPGGPPGRPPLGAPPRARRRPGCGRTTTPASSPSSAGCNRLPAGRGAPGRSAALSAPSAAGPGGGTAAPAGPRDR